MTRCEFFTEDDRITGFCVSGHSGYAEAGSDIVCAAISAVVTMAEATINDVLGAQAKYRIQDGDNNFVKLSLPVSCDEEESVQAVLTGMMLTLGSVRDEYPDFIEDAAQTVAWTLAHMGEYGTVTGVYVGGSSAGGYLSQMLCFDESWYAKFGVQPSQIAGYIHDAGQPTCHFNVLRERGIDNRRIIVDESAPLYHIAADRFYPPMLVIVSDNDIQNRYEQTMLLLSTLKHFGYEGLAQLQQMHGGHCAYVKAVDENGDSVFGKLICQFIVKEK